MNSIMTQERTVRSSGVGTTRMSRTALALLATIWLARVVHAEVQNDAVGFSPNHILESSTAGEHIDVLSGNLTLTIPIGPRYKLNDNFGYGLTLYYNSKIWEHDCTEAMPTQSCAGTLPAYDTYGLGFSLLPGRIYHHDNDKAWVFRIQLEDGSEHFFCDPLVVGYPGASTANCDEHTTDLAHISVDRLTVNDPGPKQGWVATFPDGHTLTFGKIINDSTHEALGTRIASAELRPDSVTPAEWVDYAYSGTSYKITQITDSHGRVTTITHGLSYPYGDSNDLAIDVPAFGNDELLKPAVMARYILRRSNFTFHDPSPGADFKTKSVLDEIELPGLNASTESYRFAYGPNNDANTYGSMLQRTLPTGAVIDYEYSEFESSSYRPRHIELIHKTLTMGSVSYDWRWTRFTANVQFPSQAFVGSNPYRVEAFDPFGNLTLYSFLFTENDTTKPAECNGRGGVAFLL